MASVSLSNRTTRIRLRSALVGIGSIAAIIALVFLATWNQPAYPATWQDEGFTLQGAMNLARYGQYAMKSSEGFRVLDQPLIANGPGVVLPIAGIFAAFGIGLLQARLVMAAFLVVTVVVFFLLTRRLYSLPVAIVASVIALAWPDEGLLLYGRHALGLVPGLLYFLLGYLAWLMAVERRSRTAALAAGLLFGLACITKGQYLLLVPAFLVFIALDRFYYRRVGLMTAGLTLGALVLSLMAWQGVQFALVGASGYAAHVDAIRSSTAVTVLALRPQRIPGSLWYLLRSGGYLYLVPGLLYVAWLARQRSLASSRSLLLLLLSVIWLAWYAFASVGWSRYAFEPLLFGAIFTARLLVDAARYLGAAGGQATVTGRPDYWRRGLAALFAIAVVVATSANLAGQVNRLTAHQDMAAERFARAVSDLVPATAPVESWEWELDVWADLNFHHPTNVWVDELTKVTQFGEGSSRLPYDPTPFAPQYMIDGPFSKWTQLYADYLTTGCCRLVLREGPYDLYQVVQPAPR